MIIVIPRSFSGNASNTNIPNLTPTGTCLGRSLYFADAHHAQRCSEAAPLRISFSHIPDLELES